MTTPHHNIRSLTSTMALVLFALWSTTVLAVTEAPTEQPAPDTSVSNDISTDADDLFPTITASETPAPQQEATDTIEGTVVLTDSVVTLNADTTSDVYVAGSTITINGEIGNDLFAAGSTITINGVVNGSARLAANKVIINGVIERNTLIFANTIILADTSALYGESHLYASAVTMNGQVNTTVIGAENVVLNGVLLNTIKSTSETVTVGSGAEFTTTATIASSEAPIIATEAKGTQYITAQQDIDDNDTELTRIAETNDVLRLEKRLVRFFFTLLIGIIVVLVWPTMLQRASTTMKQRPGATWALGAVTLTVVPVVLTGLFFSLIGTALAIVLFFVYLLFLLFGSLATAYLLGQHIVTERSVPHPAWRRVLTLTVGHFILSMAMLTPWVGWLIGILVVTWGLGGVVLQCKRKKR